MQEKVGLATVDLEKVPVIKQNPVCNKVNSLEIETLEDFQGHPFKSYEGQRFTDMVESIRANGMLSPIIVRPKDGGKYEILAGHNRVRAAKFLGLETVPAIVRRGLSEEEALLIVTETNLIQRSFADLKHSERAVALATHYHAMKKRQGYRSDLLREIDDLTCAPLGLKMKTRDKLGAHYGLKKTSIARYLRINALIPELKARLDDAAIALRVGEALSFLSVKEQQAVEGFLADGAKISIKQADALKGEIDRLKKEAEKAKGSDRKELDADFIKRVLEPEHSPAEMKPINLRGSFLSKYFKENQSPEEIEAIIASALQKYANQE